MANDRFETVDLLKEAGAGISRRTVAKYRMEMGVADASGRKSYR